MPFDVHADASDEQLGAVLSQGGKPLAFYTRKLNSAQRNNTVGEKELLGLVEALKAFDSTVRGQEINLYTDHLNLLYTLQPSQRMVRWRLLLEEYGPKVRHIAGELNLVADALSRLDILEDEFDVLPTDSDLKPLVYEEEKLLLVNTKFELLMPMASERTMKDDRFPLEPKVIAEYQLKSDNLVKEHKLSASEVKDLLTKELDGVQVVHF